MNITNNICVSETKMLTKTFQWQKIRRKLCQYFSKQLDVYRKDKTLQNITYFVSATLNRI